ncbi:MAG: helix-turn-helix domain-containing protein [Acidobacteria bacterium]|nr:helix-turn-helix domain-containing protein [Acidobacteriota bacterium]MBI3279072.1 helix-turn-helix domain-containing protein [Acidobacteriota bacterium]
MGPLAPELNLEHFRRRSGVSLDHITDRTKISVRFLRAIEAEEFDKLPGGVFNTSYIRQYAAAIGYCEQELLAHYEAWTRAANPESDPPPPRNPGWKAWLSWFRPPSPAQRY